MTNQVAITNLDADHLIPLQQSLRQILSTELAGFTFAQVVDGIPVEGIDTEYLWQTDISGRVAPSEAAVKAVLRWKSIFKADDLSIASDTVQAYQNTTPGTVEFYVRLIEMIAVCLHKVATELFVHTNEPPYKCRQRPSFEDLYPIYEIAGLNGEMERVLPLPAPPEKPTYLHHAEYTLHEQYPMGVADMVGYWTEYRILGGVVLFDRGESEEEVLNVYLHPSAGYRAFKLSQTQLDAFIAFCLDSEDTIPCPFPMKAERHALRIHPDDTFHLHIFRDKYERNPPVPLDPGRSIRHPRRILLEDDPDAMEDYLKMQEYLRESDARRKRNQSLLESDRLEDPW